MLLLSTGRVRTNGSGDWDAGGGESKAEASKAFARGLCIKRAAVLPPLLRVGEGDAPPLALSGESRSIATSCARFATSLPRET